MINDTVSQDLADANMSSMTDSLHLVVSGSDLQETMATRGRSSSSHQGGATQQFLQFVERKESDVFHTTIREPETDPVLAGGNVASPHPSVGW
jgi:hypothetical protein